MEIFRKRWPPVMAWGMLLIATSSASFIGDWISAMGNDAPNRIALPLHGNVYPNGYYNVTIYVGQPARPYFLDIDTGSDLTWLQCDAPCVECTQSPHPLYYPSNSRVPCKDPLCASLQPSGEYICQSPDQCDYEVHYADGGSSLGVLLNDALLFNSTKGKRLSPLLALGCGYDQLPGPGASSHPIDGILGLGKGKTSIASQLSDLGLTKNVLGHCLSSRGGGFLFFGDGFFDPSRVAWRPMSPDHPRHYSPGLAELYLGSKPTGIRNMQVAVDSGSSYTYLNSVAYLAFISLVKGELVGKPLREDPNDRSLPICWRGRKPFTAVREVRKYFKSWGLSFSGGGRAKPTQFLFNPEDYLIVSFKGNVCLGVLNGTEVGLGRLNVIGDVSMLDRMVIYDNEKKRIGWTIANCNRIPK